MDWNSWGSIWDGVTETISDGLGWASSTTDTARDVMDNVQDVSQSVKKTTLNARETANAEQTVTGFSVSSDVVKTAALVGGGAVLLLVLIKVLK